MNWAGIDVRIQWNRCRRRRWPAAPRLALGPEERRKHCNVLLYWWAGHGERALPTGRVTLKAGTCHWARPGWTYVCTQAPTDPLGVTAIHFDLVDSRKRIVPPAPAILPPEQLQVRNPPLVESVTRRVAELALNIRAGGAPDSGEEKAITCLFRGLLMMLDHDTPANNHARDAVQPGRIAAITAYIHEHISALPPIETLAERWGCTRSHFSRLFKQYTGLSPRAYAVNARVALASELLEQNDLPVTEVAAQAGYADIFVFSKQFKKITGLSPSAFRAKTGIHQTGSRAGHPKPGWTAA